ncbi:TonB-dependent receptor plug domain-containing protein [Pseudoxanthomonas broegbernensis]|uniref:TonB-dependent receptor plug domain-containing protein n=1 Tax=Pseudoxanthomonas broegbernensis TaxID=83619 RepID=UPI001391D143|nr:TonB-dependent receptor [Pseudoxanthomonas broegbernensis]MBB6066308.1 outer membrane receptor protein involved in Fe transport [Pseudoxanthomonas broegbernensis]
MIGNKSPHLLARSILLCLGGFAIGAHAAPPQPASGPDERPQKSPPAASGQQAREQASVTLDAISVTGSRVVGGDYESPTPVTMIEFEQIELAAPNNIADYLNTLPSMVGDSTTMEGNNSISAGATGMNRLNLRGLGADRTLVLVDGRRFVGSTLEGNVDINGLPNGLIRSIDVVTGGASSVYGSDAVAGVVNFVLDTRYTGLKGFAQVGQSRYHDDRQQNGGLTFGTPFADGRGHFLLNAEYAHNSGVGAARDRPWYGGHGIMTNPAWTPTNGEPYRITVPFLNRPNEASAGLIPSGPLKWTTFDADGSPRQFDYGVLDLTGSASSGGEVDGHFATMSLKGAVERHSLFARGSFEINDAFEAFAEASHSRSVVNTNSSYNYYNGSLSIKSDNAYLDPRTREAMVAAGASSAPYGLLLGVASPRVEVNTYRAVFGVNGSFGDNWTLDAYYQYGESRLNTVVNNVTNTTRLGLALDAVVDPASNRIVCRSTLADPGNGCVPINTFGGASLSEPALDYVIGEPSFRQTMKQQVASASIQGEAFSTWAGPVMTAFGIEHRREAVGGAVDDQGQPRQWLFGNFMATHGENRINEVFSEMLMPLTERSLAFNGAVRVADYSYSGIAVTWKGGLTWQPNDSVLLRTVRSRDIRAPNLGNLYQAGLTQRQNVRDPWFNDTQRNIERISQGNLALKPEVADTSSIGLALTPARWPGVRGAIDYYQIEIKDAIATLNDQQTVDRCHQGDTAVCSFVVRDGTGAVSGLIRTPINIAKRTVRGVDMDVSYLQAVPFIAPGAELDLRLVASRLLESRNEDPFSSIDYADENIAGSAKQRALLTATFRNGPLRFGASARFIGKGVLSNEWVDGVDIDDNTVPSTWYLGLFGSYHFPGDRLEAFFRVDNALDRAPLVIGTNRNGINPVLYDVIGRYASVGVRFQF